MTPAPPPVSATSEAPWCGARNGGRSTSPLGGSVTPAAEWMQVASTACRPLSRGSRPGEASGQHRLAGAGRADHQQVVATGGRDLERLAGAGLAPHIGQVGHRGLDVDGGRWRRVGPRRLTPQRVDQRLQVGDASDLAPTGDRRLAHGVGRHHQDRGHRSGRQRDGAGNRADGTVEAQLTDEGQLLDPVALELPGRQKEADGHRQVEGGAHLADRGGGEVDGDPFCWASRGHSTSGRP